MLMIFFFKKFMAGVAGFEPAHHGIKTRCLTAWLHPIKTQSNKQVILKLLDYCVKLMRIFIQMIFKVLIENVA